MNNSGEPNGVGQHGGLAMNAAKIERLLKRMTQTVARSAAVSGLCVASVQVGVRKRGRKPVAVVAVLSGEIPPECVRDFVVLANRWKQDLTIGQRRVIPLREKKGRQ